MAKALERMKKPTMSCNGGHELFHLLFEVRKLLTLGLELLVLGVHPLLHSGHETFHANVVSMRTLNLLCVVIRAY